MWLQFQGGCQDDVSCWAFFSLFFLPSHAVASAVQSCVVLCVLRAVSWCLGSVLSCWTYQGRPRDRLHFSSNEICQRQLHSGHLTVQKHHLPVHRRGREGDRRVERNKGETERGGDLALGLFVRLCACLSNCTLMNKALCRAGMPHSSEFKPEEQTATASLLSPTGTEQNTNVLRR